MYLTVKILKGPECTLEVTEGDSIRHVKQQAAIRLCIPVQHQRIVYRGKTLSDEKSLRQCGITDNTKVFLVTKRAEEFTDSSTSAKPNIWDELHRFLVRHFTEHDARLVLEQVQMDLKDSIDSMSLDDIERLATSFIKRNDSTTS